MYWYDQPSAYQGEPEIEFFDRVKAVWDETKVISGQVGEYITVARRSGSEWFVGAITNTEERQITIPTDFLVKGKKYVVKSFQDDDKVATRTKVAVSEFKIKGGEVLNFNLKSSGGVALIISEVSTK